MNVKRCTFDPIPEPPEPTPCQIQKKKQKEKAGVIWCPKPPPPCPEEPAECLALCIEKIKNPEIGANTEQTVCVVERVLPTTQRCDAILEATRIKPIIRLPCPPPPPPPPPPPGPTPCEIQREKFKKRECYDKIRKFYVD